MKEVVADLLADPAQREPCPMPLATPMLMLPGRAFYRMTKMIRNDVAAIEGRDPVDPPVPLPRVFILRWKFIRSERHNASKPLAGASQ